MKLLWKVSLSTKTRAWRSLASGSVARTPPFTVFHVVSLASGVGGPMVVILALSRSSRK